MPPRKKLKGSPASLSSTERKSKQTHHQHHNNKYYGIEHFFERHSSTSQSPHAAATTTTTTTTTTTSNGCCSGNPKPLQEQEQELELDPSKSNCPDSPAPLLPNPTGSLQPLPPPPAGGGGEGEVSPEMMSSSKSSSLLVQRFNFSPTMLIKQSQDDGAVDEVTWKISPINQRLNSLLFPHLHLNTTLLPIRPCSLKGLPSDTTTTTTTAAAADEVVASTTSGRPLVPCTAQQDFSQVKPLHSSSILHHPANAVSSSLSTRHHPPFTTPPSLSYSQQRISMLQENEALDQLGLRQHKKALIELLDQVEGALSCENSQSSEIKIYSSDVQETNSYGIPLAADRVAKGAPQEGAGPSSNQNFLVLEVSEKYQPATSSGAQCPYKLLRLLNEQTGEERAVHLWEEWFYTVIAPGDTANVIGEFDEQGKCNVDHDNNLLIVHPDLLISGTRVAASFSCSRRTVLDERLKCNENSTAALIGTLLHQIFQAGLVKENPTIKFLEEIAGVALRRNIESLYACRVHEKDAMKTLVDAVPKIMNWITILKNAPESEEPIVDFGCEFGLKKLRITEVIDIEEMAWAPKYGLKGMIDASVRVRMDPSIDGLDEKIVPLEFKTGKVPNGQPNMEHSAQVILYALLMSERYLKNIDSGLLCYLHSDQAQGIVVQRSDIVGLIMRRNELASDILKASMTQQLPPMLRSPNVCRGCRHLDSCTIYHKVHGGSMESSGLGDIFDSHVQHLTSVHCAFFQHWEWLIDLEAKEAQLTKNEIWRSRSLNSYRSASCISSFVLDTSTGFLHQRSPKDNCYMYRFVRQTLPSHLLSVSDGNSYNAPPLSIYEMESTLKIGDYVILSTESGQQNVASGVIMDVNHSHVSVSVSKRLRLPGSKSLSESNNLLGEIWRIDKDEAMTSFSVMRFNLVQLVLPSPQSSHLRKIIVDLEAPRFDSGCIFSQDPAISYIWSVKTLNADQRRSILKILTAKDYALILGMPGTGKTSTMVHAVRALLIRGASILLTSYTNSAVDNLLIKLKAQGIDFLRVGRHEAIREEIWAHCLSALGDQSVEDIRLKLEQVKVVAVTCLGVANPLLANKKFDVCIMDEAGQITLPISLAPLMHASMFVLVGDHYQLPPLVQSTEARENGMAVSLFCRLSEAHPQAVSALRSQYRMCQGIMKLSNALIYGDRLRCGSSEIANSKLTYSSSEFSSLWLKEVLNPSRTVIFINTDMLPAFEARESKTLNNPIEAYLIAEIVQELINKGIEGEDIGIITPYNSQANLVRSALCIPSIEIQTIDKYQGRDKDCVLVSFVRSSETTRNCVSSLLGDWHRINVALTRAKKKLIMVGSCKTLSKVPLLKLLIKEVEEQSGLFKVSKDDFTCNEGLGLPRLKRWCSQLR